MKKKMGRPPHKTKPVFLGTTISAMADRRLRSLAKQWKRPRSKILTDVINLMWTMDREL